MRSFRLQALALALVAGSAFAQAVPTKLSFTGRIVDNGVPVQGTRDFVFKLYPTIVGGSDLWLETRNGVMVTDGTVNVELGASTPLTPAIFDGQTLYLEVTVGTTVLSPRTPVLSVPYALRATVASQVGSLTAAQVQQRVASTCGAGAAIQAINADGTVVCQAVGANDAGVTSITNITAGSGLTGGGSTGNVSLAANFGGTGSATTVSRSDHNHTGVYLPLGPVLACSGTDKVVGLGTNGSVICAVDTSNTYGVLTGGGLALNGSNQFSLAVCPTAGHVYKMVGGVWTCSPDADTAPLATPPIAVTGNTVSLTTCPNAGEILKMSSGSWRCLPDDNTVGVTAVNASAPLASTGGTAPTLSLGVVPVSLGGAGTSLATTGGARQFVKQGTAGGPLTVGLIAAAELPTHQHAAGTDITGTLSVANGGTGAALTATGGPGQVVKQLSAGGPFSVGTLTTSDLPPLPATVQNWSTQPSCPPGQTLSAISAAGAPTCVGPGLVDSAFNIQVQAGAGVFAAVWVPLCTGTCANITIPSTYAYGSTSGTVTITRTGPGSYTVNIPGVGNAVPQVTAYGGGPIFCKSNGWSPGSYAVSCYSAIQ